MLTFASEFASNFLHCVYHDVGVFAQKGYRIHSLHYVLLPLLLLFSKPHMQILTLSVNGPLC